MIFKEISNRSSRAIASVLFVLFTSIGSFAQSPTCNCDDLIDPDDYLTFQDYIDAYDACVAQNCMVPVNGNIWFLAAAGIVLAVIKMGGYKFLLNRFIRFKDSLLSFR